MQSMRGGRGGAFDRMFAGRRAEWGHRIWGIGSWEWGPGALSLPDAPTLEDWEVEGAAGDAGNRAVLSPIAMGAGWRRRGRGRGRGR